MPPKAAFAYGPISFDSAQNGQRQCVGVRPAGLAAGECTNSLTTDTYVRKVLAPCTHAQFPNCVACRTISFGSYSDNSSPTYACAACRPGFRLHGFGTATAACVLLTGSDSPTFVDTSKQNPTSRWSVDLRNLTSLQRVENYAFAKYKGTLNIEGPLPGYKGCTYWSTYCLVGIRLCLSPSHARTHTCASAATSTSTTTSSTTTTTSPQSLLYVSRDLIWYYSLFFCILFLFLLC